MLATISDKKIPVSGNGTSVDWYVADVVTAQDYYPFGSIMPGRKFSAANAKYRYGFNGKEKDNETTGTSTYDYGFRIYNPGLARFLSVDPLSKEYPWNTPYAFAENDVIRSIDLDGLEKLIVIEYYDAANNKTKAIFMGMRDSKTKEAVNMNMKSALNIKLTTQDVYIIRYNHKGKIFFEGPGGKLDNYYRKIITKAPKVEGEYTESLPDNTMQQTEVTTRGRFVKSDLISNIENEFFEKVITFPIPKPKVIAEKIQAQKIISSPLPSTTTSTSTFSSSIDFWPSTASTKGSIKSEIDDIISSVSGKSDYNITIFGNFNGTASEDFNTEANVLAWANGYETYGDLALARANRIKQKLVAAGLNASKINTTLGDPQGRMNASYKITTTTIK